MKNEFQIGDRVMVLWHPCSSVVGYLGTVVEILGNSEYGVEHDHWGDSLHTLGGRCKSGYGWWYLSKYLALVQAEPEVRDCNLKDFLEDT